MSDNFIKDKYDTIAGYADKKQLENTKKALSFSHKELMKTSDMSTAISYYNHALSIAWMIFELHLPISPKDEDHLMAVALCHVIPELLEDYDVNENFEAEGLDKEVAETVLLITRSGLMTDEQQATFYEQIKQHRLAIIVRLVDRSNLIEQLCFVSPREAKDYILETKKYILPMCIYGKEHFPEYFGGICIVMEKMRSLIQVMDVLFAKYENEEAALNDEILSLAEDNARLRGIIADLEKEIA